LVKHKALIKVPYLMCSNRSAAYLHLGKHEEALSDATQCISLKPNWEKGHFRAGSALEAMGDLAAVREITVDMVLQRPNLDPLA
jgi:tetratricopeptide (TPR) repeat protein